MRLPRLAASIAVVTGGVVLISACLPQPSLWTGSGLRVAVVGDSQIYMLQHDKFGDAEQNMTDALVASGYEVSTSDMIGAKATDLPPFMAPSLDTAGWPATGPQIAVTALGVNDMHVDPTTEQSMTPISIAEFDYGVYLNFVDAAGSRCDVLVQIPETTPWGLNQTGAVWNAFLSSIASQSTAVVVPWASTVAQHPEYLGPDGVHQTAAGKVAYLGAITSALNTCAQYIGTASSSTVA